MTLRLVRIPAGRFVMGSADGEADEHPPADVAILATSGSSTCEITNEQFRRFDPAHYSGLFMKRSLDDNGPGIDMDGPSSRPCACRGSRRWRSAAGLSEQTGAAIRLAHRGPVGIRLPGRLDRRSSATATSRAISRATPTWPTRRSSRMYTVTGGVVVLQDIPCDTRFDDQGRRHGGVGSYQPNAWGLYDMHGNAAEWTRSTYRPYPYRDDDGRNEPAPNGRKVVRGGSFYDRPQRCRSAFRLSYPAWQRVHNVGFRVVCEAEGVAVAELP